MTRGHNVVVDGWAGASNPHPNPNLHPPHTNIDKKYQKRLVAIFCLDHNGQTDGRMDKASYRVACPQLKRRRIHKDATMCWTEGDSEKNVIAGINITCEPDAELEKADWLDVEPESGDVGSVRLRIKLYRERTDTNLSTSDCTLVSNTNLPMCAHSNEESPSPSPRAKPTRRSQPIDPSSNSKKVQDFLQSCPLVVQKWPISLIGVWIFLSVNFRGVYSSITFD